MDARSAGTGSYFHRVDMDNKEKKGKDGGAGEKKGKDSGEKKGKDTGEGKGKENNERGTGGRDVEDDRTDVRVGDATTTTTVASTGKSPRILGSITRTRNRTPSEKKDSRHQVVFPKFKKHSHRAFAKLQAALQDMPAGAGEEEEMAFYAEHGPKIVQCVLDLCREIESHPQKVLNITSSTHSVLASQFL